MTFNSGARLDPSRIQRRGAGTGAGGMAIGGGIGGLVLLLVAMFLGVDLSQLGLGSAPGSEVTVEDPALQEEFNDACQTGASANERLDCRMVGAVNSLDAFWESELPRWGTGLDYPGVVVFNQYTQSACGTASSQTGPFYCPADTTIYMDTSFFSLLEQQFGSSDGPLAQIYVMAHEYGHHIQNQLGVFQVADRSETGEGSDAVKVELMADCLAGVWAKSASSVPDESGTPFLAPLTDRDIQDALDAASAVGDDHIQQATQGTVNPDSFSHGTSEQRQQAFLTGYETGSVGTCDSFGVTQG